MKQKLCVMLSHKFVKFIQLSVSALVLTALITAPRNAAAADNVVNFNNSAQYITTSAKITTTDFTVEAWFKLYEYISESQLISQYQSGSGRMILGLKDDKAGMFISGVGGWHLGATAIPTNTWNHIAMTRSGSFCSLYINGSLYHSATITDIALADTTFTIGNISTASSSFRGDISDVRVWNTARSQTEIQTTMNTRLEGSESNLSYYWPLNEGIGSTTAEIVSAADGTIGGAGWSFSTDLPIVSSLPDPFAWNSAQGGNWSDDSNWLNARVPNVVDAITFFTNNPPAAITVTNDLANVKLGYLEVKSASPHTFTGNTLTLTNSAASSGISVWTGNHTFDLPITISGNGAAFQPTYPASLILPNVLSGSGFLSFNSALNSGLVKLEGANTYTGTTILNGGTVEIDTLSNGGAAGPFGAATSDPANLVLGPGTLRYTGGNVTTDRGYTANAGQNYAAIIDTDSDITFGGQIQALSGAMLKIGSGTISYTYPGENTYTVYEGNPAALLDLPDNGDSPNRLGFAGLTIIDGKIVIGVPGQTNIITKRINIGGYTTDSPGAETTGELEINDGYFQTTTTLSLGRHNGTETTAPGGISSKLTVNGGECYFALVAVGNNYLGLEGYNARPVYEINGGYVEHNTVINMSENAGCVSTLNVNGGHLKVINTAESIRVGMSGDCYFNINNDAVVEVSGTVKLARNDLSNFGICYLNGGTLIANNIVKGGGIDGTVYFNGGVLKPNADDQILSGLTAAYVSTNGAVFDTTLANYTIEQALLHDPELGATTDGGLTKLGVSNGILRLLTSLPGSTDLIVAPDGELQAEGNQSVGNLTQEAGGTLGFGFAADGTLNDQLTITSGAVFSDGQVALYHDDTDLPFTKNGTYTIVNYSGTTPDVSGLSCANPVFGKLYTFVADSGTVTVTIANDSAGASIWNVNGSGNWADGSNWTLAQPGTAGSTARFDDAISAPVTVSTGGESAGALYFNSPYDYTIGGSGLTLDNSGAEAHLTVEHGEHAITAPVTLNDDTSVEFSPSTLLSLGAVSGASATLTAQGLGTLMLTDSPAIGSLLLNSTTMGLADGLALSTAVELQGAVKVAPEQSATSAVSATVTGSGGLDKTGSSILELTGGNSYTGPTTISGGTLRVAELGNGGSTGPVGASSSSADSIVLREATMHITGSGTTDRGYTVDVADTARAAVLRVDGEVTFAGQVNAVRGGLVKTGSGTVYHTYPHINQVNKTDINKPAGPMNIGEFGDGPDNGVTGLTIADGAMVFDGGASQTNYAVGHIELGMYTSTEPGGETTGELIVNSGAFLAGGATISVGRKNGSTTTAPGGLTPRLVLNDGMLQCGTLALGNSAGLANYNARPTVEVNGGEMWISGVLNIGERPSENYASLLVSGGKVNVFHATLDRNMRIGGTSLTAIGGNSIAVISGDGEINIMKGRVDIAYGRNCEGTLRLDGGTLLTRNIVMGAGSLAQVYFNGGTLIPTLAGQSMSGAISLLVSTNGAVINTAQADYTIPQAFNSDSSLNGAKDGGLTKIGTNPLTLSSAANTFNGPVRVTEGTLSAQLNGTNDLDVTAGATFDALAANNTIGALSGEGELVNGIITVHGALDCGDSGAEAGAELSVANLTMVGGSSYVCDWSTNALGEATCDYAERHWFRIDRLQPRAWRSDSNAV